MAEESSLKKGVMVMKGDLRVLAEQTVAWRQKVPPVRKERGVRVDIDAVAEHTESHARTKKTGVCVFVCVRGGGTFQRSSVTRPSVRPPVCLCHPLLFVWAFLDTADDK